jgi:hypothetical protein
VFEELCEIVTEPAAPHERDGRPLPPPISGRDWANAITKAMSDA